MSRGRVSGLGCKPSKGGCSSYGSICEVRRLVGLGCRGCVLAGTVACSLSGGVGEPAPNLSPLRTRGVFGGKTVDGYRCHVDLTFLIT
jgi:hypothetical protein